MGAGMSIPFGIPTMKQFTELFEGKIINNEEFPTDQKEIYLNIKKGTKNTGLSFDLELFMSILNDLKNPSSRLTLPTVNFLLDQGEKSLKPEKIQENYKDISASLYKTLIEFIKETIMEPLNTDGIYEVLDLVYFPIFGLLGFTGEVSNTPQAPLKNIFTTNWDYTIREWMKYRNLYFDDGAKLNRQGDLSFDVKNSWSGDEYHIIPLHGSIDFEVTERKKITGEVRDINKVTGKKAVASNPFIIYPLEAVGYEDTVKSPYFDLMIKLRQVLETDKYIFVIGFSFRDPTISSIFEDVLRERHKKGDWIPLEGEFEERKEKFKENNPKMKFLLVDSNPRQVFKNMERQGFFNISKACLPIKIDLPTTNLLKGGFDIQFVKEKMENFTLKVGAIFEEIGLFRDRLGKKDVYRNIEKNVGLSLLTQNEWGEEIVK